jgi:hypothetical protein
MCDYGRINECTSEIQVKLLESKIIYHNCSKYVSMTVHVTVQNTVYFSWVNMKMLRQGSGRSVVSSCLLNHIIAAPLASRLLF